MENIFTKGLAVAANVLPKAAAFLLGLFARKDEIAKEIGSLSAPTLGAMSATFYDVTRAIDSGLETAAAAESKDVILTLKLSLTTLALIKQVIQDGKDDATIIAKDLKALGIVLKGSGPSDTPPVAA